MSVRFDDALPAAIDVLRRHAEALASAGAVVVVRDLFGRLRLAFEHEHTPSAELISQLQEAAGPFFLPSVLLRDQMHAPEAVFDATDAIAVPGLTGFKTLERLVTGADWTRPELPNKPPRPPRATLYGIKGGVGRSTALVVWARHLANEGRRVLVLDLDLESPGVSSSLVPAGAGPDVGIVDWLVEDAVGNADDELVRLMLTRSPLAEGTSGEILLASCGDASSGTYLSKLARAYLEIPARGPSIPHRSFADRIGQLVDALEVSSSADVVLIDSRAGLHDLAGIATSRLGAMTFFFASSSRQTWDGYRSLLRHWRAHPIIAQEIRNRIKMVAAQVPEIGGDAYLERYLDESYEMFAETMYEDTGEENPDAFNFDIRASEAPHFPLRINWLRGLQGGWDPLEKDVTPDQLHSSMGSFVEGATELLFADEIAEDGAEDGED